MDSLPYLSEEQQQVLLTGPALKAPEGVDPIFAGPPNSNVLAHIVMALCVITSSACFLVRIYSRTIRERKFTVQEGESKSPPFNSTNKDNRVPVGDSALWRVFDG